jgi:hypothetical protein
MSRRIPAGDRMDPETADRMKKNLPRRLARHRPADRRPGDAIWAARHMGAGGDRQRRDFTLTWPQPGEAGHVAAGSAGGDDEEDFSHLWPPSTPEEAEHRAAEARHVAAARRIYVGQTAGRWRELLGEDWRNQLGAADEQDGEDEDGEDEVYAAVISRCYPPGTQP